jgi:branched-chain amino acid transport system ATP-binding protein
MSDIILEVHDIRRSFQGFRAVDGVSLTIARGERRALIGPNGAGKTTLFNLVSGRLAPSGGDVRYEGKSIVGQPSHAICRRGMARTFQITSVFPKLTALQNVQTAIFSREHRSHWLFRSAARIDAEAAHDCLVRVGIGHLGDVPGSLMSYGDQKRVELAMVLALKPRLLLLDEPTAGVDVDTRRALVNLIKDLCTSEGLSLLFCEHDMDAVFSIADRVTVLHQGKILTEGDAAAVQSDARVREVYLGANHGGAR